MFAKRLLFVPRWCLLPLGEQGRLGLQDYSVTQKQKNGVSGELTALPVGG